MTPSRARPTPAIRIIAAIFAAAGVAHFVMPEFFIRIVPPSFPSPAALVAISGVAELAGALGILVPATRRVAGWGLILLLLAVFPANVYMLRMAMAAGASTPFLAGLWLRLPLQAVLIWWVWRATVRPAARRNGAR